MTQITRILSLLEDWVQKSLLPVDALAYLPALATGVTNSVVISAPYWSLPLLSIITPDWFLIT